VGTPKDGAPSLLLRLGGAGIGAARVAIGVVALIRPATVANPWVGADQTTSPASSVLGRATGGRDVALGVGAVLAARRTAVGGLIGWTAAGAFCDAVDAAATGISWDRLPKGGRVAVAAAATSGAVMGGLLALGLAAARRG
jgi:uncharacterized protein YfiM (DUF2279 family)